MVNEARDPRLDVIGNGAEFGESSCDTSTATASTKRALRFVSSLSVATWYAPFLPARVIDFSGFTSSSS